MDFTDLLVNTSDEYLTGYYYAKRPKTEQDGRITFKYKQLDANSKMFNTVLGDIRADSATYAISTNDMCGFKVGGYIATQNGLFWLIEQVITNEQADSENAALRWFKKAKGAMINIRMTQVDNLYTESTYALCAVAIQFTAAPDNVAITVYETVDDVRTNIPYEIIDNELIFNVPKKSMVLVAYGDNLIKIQRSDTVGDEYTLTVE